jgi:hypothetical protein
VKEGHAEDAYYKEKDLKKKNPTMSSFVDSLEIKARE